MGKKVDEATEKLATEVADVADAAADVVSAAKAEAKAARRVGQHADTERPLPYRGVRK